MRYNLTSKNHKKQLLYADLCKPESKQEIKKELQINVTP
jgi:hypothetical protein